ncbi:putative urate catabolism protein [Rhizobiales bacterium GAS191]|nr:putative urate catabolism protein [Rhizobiales bacterium GAS191]
MITADYPRDLRGYGSAPPHPRWPNGARIAISFVLNYEEGGERTILDGDPCSESYLVPEISQVPAHAGERALTVESLYEYGSRSGFWRILRLFNERRMPLTCWAVGIALARNPCAATAMVEGGHEVASHSWRWFDYSTVSEDEERQHIRMTVDTIRRLTGHGPRGWYTGRFSVNTRRLVMEEAPEVLYDSDSYNDDLPFWTKVDDKPRLIVPYALDTNDFKFSLSPGWTSGEDFTTYLKAAFDHLYREGAQAPKMMSVGLHCRLTGRPARAEALSRFLDYVASQKDVWVCRREEIARHWMTHFPANG